MLTRSQVRPLPPNSNPETNFSYYCVCKSSPRAVAQWPFPTCVTYPTEHVHVHAMKVQTSHVMFGKQMGLVTWWSDQETWQENNDGPAFAFQRISWDVVKACACRTSCQSTAQLFQHELSHTCTHTHTYTRARNISSVFPTLNIALHTQHFHTQLFHIQVFRTSFFHRQLFHTHTPLFHRQLFHTLFRIQLRHTELFSHTALSH